MINKALFASKKEDWETPQDLYDRLDRIFHFETDVCATKENAKCKNYFDKEKDGLKQEWEGICWMNPPYGRQIGKWIKKASESKAITVALLPARTDTKWFHEYIYRKTAIIFLKGRVKFAGAKGPAPFPSMIVIFRP